MIGIRFKKFFFILLIVGFLGSILFLTTQTSIFFKQENSTVFVKENFRIDEGESAGVILLLLRDQETPQAYDWMSIDGRKYAVFTADDMNIKTITAKVNIPHYVPSGKYKVDYRLTYIDSQKQERGEITFFVR